MRKWKRPSWVTDQEDFFRANPDVTPKGKRIWLKNYTNTGRVFMTYDSDKWPYIELSIDDKKIVLDIEELNNWMRYA